MATIKKYNGSTWENATVRKYGTATETIQSGDTIYADGTVATVSLKGNEQHTGTPSPSNPVDVNGVGVRTENLWNESYTGIKMNVITYKPLNVGDGDYTLSSTVTVQGQAAVLFLLAGNVSTGATTVDNGVWSGQSRTVTAVNGYVTIGYRKYIEANPENANTMLNSGSTAKPFEPYGYKIPISSANTTTPVYLGEVESTRRIKKLVLTGQENLDINNSCFVLWFNSVSYPNPKQELIYCTHYEGRTPTYRDSLANGQCMITINQNQIAIKDLTYATVEDFKSYLAAQYAAGTPVTVWYVLATEETGIVNEPLMKIGNYSDTLSNATSIPTTEGANNITVDTTVQPSEFTATWTGWHDATVKEAKHGNNLFDYTTMSVSDENSYLNADGSIGSSTDWNISDYIPCDGTSFTVGDIGGNTPAICLYNANKEYITGKSYNTGGTYSKQAVNITSQTTAKFIRFSYCKGSLNPDDISAIMLNNGSTLLPYEPYSIHWE